MKNYAKGVSERLIKSFKSLDRNNFHIFLADVIFYLVLAQIFIGASAVANNFIQKIAYLPGGPSLTALRDLGISLSAVGILTLIFVIAWYSLIKGFVWTLISRRKMSFYFFRKFFLLNLVWIGIYFLIFLVFALGAKPGFLAGVIVFLAVLFVHLTTFLHYDFAHNAKISKAFRAAFHFGFSKIHHFVLPYIFTAILFFILLQVGRLVPPSMPQNTQALIFLTLVVSPLLAWFRIYMAGILEKL